MFLVLLAISLTVALCFLAFRFAVFALPVMAAIAWFQYLADPGLGLTALCSIAGLFVGIAAVANLNTIGDLAE